MTPIQQLEREWKKDRNKGATQVLNDFWLDNGIDPAAEFKRLEEEVELDIRREVIEELSGEHGNLNDEPWKMHVLTQNEPPTYGSPPVQPDFVVPDGGVLWIEYRDHQRVFTMDYAPEYLQSDLERELEDSDDSPEFVTVFNAGETEYLADAETGDLYRLVRSGRLGEKQCPYADWDPAEREDVRDREVSESDTWFGEHPGKLCRLCEAEIGEKHGYLYLGEEAEEAVYWKLKERQLPSTVDTPEIEAEIRDEFETTIADPNDQVDVFYEHGQWWVRRTQVDRSDPSGRNDLEDTYSVVDTDTGFDFEET